MAVNFDLAPILLFLETTRACELACLHCRAEAIASPLPEELTHEEALRLIDDVRGFDPRPPVLVFTGGDPLMREDLFDLAGHARSLGIAIGFAPSVTPRLTRSAAARMRELGARTVSVSLDGASPATHEGIRGIEGHLRATLDAVRMLVAEGLTVQVNTTVMGRNAEELADIGALVAELGARIWEVFFLVRTGRGRRLEELSPQENEDVAHFLVEASRYGFVVRTVEAPFFRRVVAERKEAGAEVSGGGRFGLGPLYGRLVARLGELLGRPVETPRAQSVGTRDGKGILFVAHDGEVFPSGFLPVSLGNVRDQSLVAIYRTNPLLLAIRQAAFVGRCGLCSYREACGGSRARAYAASGDVLGEDPACLHSRAS